MVSESGLDDDATFDVDDELLGEVRAEAAARRAEGAAGEVSKGALAIGAGGDSGGRGAPVIEGYVELREIGRGGFSQVYEGLQLDFNRWVAIKVLSVRLLDDHSVEAFERECRLMGVLSRHPNVVTVLANALTSGRRPCIVMELFVDGSYLNVLRRVGPLGLEELLPLGVRMAGALASAHRLGVVHGDVKPQNIFRSEFGTPALGDFGIAALMGAASDEAGLRLSVHYAAPELIEHGASAVSPAVDQYALAATIYALATGRRPFASDAGDTTGDVLTRALTGPPPRLGQEFPVALADLLERAMAREPNDRHRDMVAFAAAVAKIEEDLGLRPTEIPITAVQARYVASTPESDRSQAASPAAAPPASRASARAGPAHPVGGAAAVRSRPPHRDQDDSDDSTVGAPATVRHLRGRATARLDAARASQQRGPSPRPRQAATILQGCRVGEDRHGRLPARCGRRRIHRVVQRRR